jgi:hypothetical protein
MILTTRNRSIAVARPSLLKPDRSSTIKSRLYQYCARDYHTNLTDVFFYIKSPGKMKCGLYTITKYIYVIVSRSLLI